MDAQHSCFILFYRITYDPFCSMKIKINVRQIRFHDFVQRCIVVEDASVRERHFPDKPIVAL